MKTTGFSQGKTMIYSDNIDDLDRSIIRELQTDGRRPLREVARTLGIAEATARLRLKRLQDEELLKIVAFADPTKLGQSHMALLFLTVSADLLDDVLDILTGLSEVSYLSTTMGDEDVCAQVICADQNALWALHQRIRQIKGVLKVRLLNEVKVLKLRFALPVDSA
jgi:Lrp/AsnC family transcriptional regulator, regulator for asnA, asnC and gidA